MNESQVISKKVQDKLNSVAPLSGVYRDILSDMMNGHLIGETTKGNLVMFDEYYNGPVTRHKSNDLKEFLNKIKKNNLYKGKLHSVNVPMGSIYFMNE